MNNLHRVSREVSQIGSIWGSITRETCPEKGHLRQLAERFQLGKLRLVVGVGDRAGSQAVAQREAAGTFPWERSS